MSRGSLRHGRGPRLPGERPGPRGRAKDDLPGYDAIHRPEFANDGSYGNGASWISNSPGSWLKIDLGQAVPIDRVLFGRDRTGSYDDRDPGQFTIATATSDNVYANGNDSNDANEYTTVVDSSALGFSGTISGAQTVQADFTPVTARFVKLMFANLGTDLDEVEVKAAATLQFSSSLYEATEDGGDATITVTRTGAVALPATVHFATSDGSAVSGADYTAVSGTLSFAAGQTSQTFAVPVLEGTAIDGARTINLALSNPSGAEMASPTTALLLVSDSQGTTRTEQYVFQLYQDLLGRLPLHQETAFLSGALDQGLGTRDQVALAVGASPEYRTEVLDGLYRKLLGRPLDAAGRDFWLGFLAQGGTLADLQANLAGSAEYFQQRGGGTVDGFLDALYQDALGRPVDAAGQAFLEQFLAQGGAPVQAADLVFRSPEQWADQVQVYYQQFLHRPADAAGLQFFTGLLQQGAREEDVLARLLSTEEYFPFDVSFISQVYLDVLQRPAGPADLAYWTSVLNDGTDRTHLVLAVQGSAEYRSVAAQSIYHRLLGRDADPASLNYWLAYLAQGGTPEGMEAQVFGSDEFLADEGGGNNDGFVQALYGQVLQRDVDAAGAKFWDQALAQGASRTAVAAALLNSPEARSDRLQDLYGQLLQRTADGGGINFFLAALQQGATPGDVIAALAGSPEYYRGTGHADAEVFTSPDDPFLLRAEAPDGGVLEYLGAKDAAGLPTALDTVITTTPDDRSSILDVDASGHPTKLLGSTGGVLSIAWLTDASARVTAVAADGSVQLSVPLDFTAAQPFPGASGLRAASLLAPPSLTPVPVPPGPADVRPVISLEDVFGKKRQLPAKQRNAARRDDVPKKPHKQEGFCDFLAPNLEGLCKAVKVLKSGLEKLDIILEANAAEQGESAEQAAVRRELEDAGNELDAIDRYCTSLEIKSAGKQGGLLGLSQGLLCALGEESVDAFLNYAFKVSVKVAASGQPETTSDPVPWQGGQPFPDFTIDPSRKVIFLPPVLQLNTHELDFTPNTTGPQTLTVTNAGPAGDLNEPLNYTITSAADCNGAWLVLGGPAQGSLVPQAAQNYAVSVNPAGLPPGVCHATITVQDKDGLRSPETVDVVLTIPPSGPPPNPVSLSGTWSGDYSLTVFGNSDVCEGASAGQAGTWTFTLAADSSGVVSGPSSMTGIVIFTESSSGACSTSTVASGSGSLDGTVSQDSSGVLLDGTVSADTSYGTLVLTFHLTQNGNVLTGTFIRSDGVTKNGTVHLTKQ